MKQFDGMHLYRGIQIPVVFCCKSVKEASQLMGLSCYYIKTYYGCVSPNNDMLLKNPNIVFASFEYSGEAGYAFRDLVGMLMPLEKIKEKIDKHREICRTYSDTIKKYAPHEDNN